MVTDEWRGRNKKDEEDKNGGMNERQSYAATAAV